MPPLTLFRKFLMSAVLGLTVAACDGDSNTELASLGTVGPNPGAGGSSSSGSSGGAGSATANCETGLTKVTLSNSDEVCSISGVIASDLTLSASNIYMLDGKVVVGANEAKDGTGGTNAVLTIPAGTKIIGKETPTSGVTSYLVVTRGSRLEATGTATQPIVFTSEQDHLRGRTSPVALNETETGEWGGIVVNGLATINKGTDCELAANVCEREGEGDSGLYGGDDDTDNSGTFSYMQVRYAGYAFTADNELNGIAFQGVGSGTTIEYVHVHNGADDGIEFFGGTANAKYIVVTGADDDSIDWTNGYRGYIQYAIVMQNANQANTDQGIEADSNSSDNDALPRARPVLSNVTLVGARPAESDIGILLREGTGAGIYNSVVSNFEHCWDIDGTATYTNSTTATGVTLKSVLFDCDASFKADTDAGEDDTAAGTGLAAKFAADANNVELASTLSSGFINGNNENSVTSVNVNTEETLTWFEFATYIGAVKSSSASDNWTLNWTYGINPTPACPTGTTAIGTTGCELTGVITDDMNLVSGLSYFLRGKVVVGADCGPDKDNELSTCDKAELTIDPGVSVYARENPLSYLVIARGSKLNSNGTASAPVTFTVEDDASRNLDSDTGLWGGLVINGRAPINKGTNCEVLTNLCERDGEGDSGKYGGNDATDDSGQIYYTVVKYAGFAFTADNELNGIAFEGVGSGTEVDYVQVHNGADDGIEFFGGTVNAKHLVVTGADDDSIDWTNGYVGNIQYAIVVQNGANQGNTDQGIEADSNSSNNDALPRAFPSLSNLTLVGSFPAATGAESDIGILLREGTGANIYNTLIVGFQDGIDIDGSATYANRDSGTTGINLKSVLIDTDTAFGDDTTAGEDDTAAGFDLPTWFASEDANNDSTTSNSLTTLSGATTGQKRYINGATENGISDTDPTVLGAFFEDAGFVGAVQSSDNWTSGWTVWLND